MFVESDLKEGPQKRRATKGRGGKRSCRVARYRLVTTRIWLRQEGTTFYKGSTWAGERGGGKPNGWGEVKNKENRRVTCTLASLFLEK